MDLIEKFEKDTSRFLWELKRFKNFTDSHPKFVVGEIIEFSGGFYNNIRFKTKILGFDIDGDIYILSDCFWFPIADNEKRKIKLISKNVIDAD